MPPPPPKPPAWDRKHDWGSEALDESDLGDQWHWRGDIVEGPQSRRRPQVEIEIEGQEGEEGGEEGAREIGGPRRWRRGFLHGILDKRGLLDVRHSLVSAGSQVWVCVASRLVGDSAGRDSERYPGQKGAAGCAAQLGSECSFTGLGVCAWLAKLLGTHFADFLRSPLDKKGAAGCATQLCECSFTGWNVAKLGM
eukprot:1156066-Pelagomonas_calceolata.AAC.2